MENAVTYQGGQQLPTRRNRQRETDLEQDNLSTLVTWFEDAEEASTDARKRSERNRDYYDGMQLTADELEALRKRGQPDVIINRVQPKIDFLIGFEAENRTDPRAFSRNPTDEHAAEAASDALRYYDDAADLDQKFSKVWENQLIEGYGGLELIIEETSDGDTEINAVSWDWDRLFYDPHSRKADFSDARYVGGVIWMDTEEAKQKWPDSEDAIENTIAAEAGESEGSQTYEDRPRWKTWVEGKARKRIRIVQMYYKDPSGEWQYCLFTKGGKFDAMPVPFVDQKGKSWCPLMLESAYVDRNNNRYGLVSQFISPQDEINKRRSKALHLLSVRQTIGERGAVDDIDQMKAELAKPDGHVEKNPGFDFDIIDQSIQLQGHVQLLQESKNEIELMGPNAALLGQGPDAASGRAIRLNKQSGMMQIARIIDRHGSLKRRTYEGIWNLIRQYKDAEWWVRVTDDEKNARWVGFNRPVTLREELAKRLEGQGLPPEEIEPMIDERMGADPRLDEVIRIENQPSQMYMDITIEQVPDTANAAEEQFEGLIQLANAGVTFPPEVYLEASSIRKKRDLIEKLDQKDPAQEELKTRAATAEVDKLEAEIAKLLSDVTLNNARAEEIGVETEIAATTPPDPPQLTPPQSNGFSPPL